MVIGQPRIGGGGSGRRTTAPTFDPEQWARAWVRSARFSLRITGQHYSGLSNQAILDVRRREGRDFAKDTAALRDHITERVAEAFADRKNGNDLAARQVARRAYREWIVLRIERQGYQDVSLKPLTPAYLAWKRKHGLDTRIGIARGNWLRAVTRADVDIDTE